MTWNQEASASRIELYQLIPEKKSVLEKRP